MSTVPRTKVAHPPLVKPNPYPDVTAPLGAEADVWQGTAPRQFRDVYTVRHVLNNTGDPLRSPIVTADAVQWSNGWIGRASVTIDFPAETELTSDQARELAAALLEAAAEVDQWVGRPSAGSGSAEPCDGGTK